MKKIVGAIIAAIMVIIIAIFGVKSLVKVPAGYVAVQYDVNGGVKNSTLTQGWHLKSPFVKTTLYTVGLEQSYLTASDQGDSPTDDSFSASSSEGKAITIELTYTYQFDPEHVNEVFTRFKGQKGKDVRDSFIKPNIISWTKEAIAKWKVSDIIGAERENVNIAITEYVSSKFEKYGIIISNVTVIDADVDQATRDAINAKIAAQQNAETQRINNQTAIDKAEADAQVQKTKAQAEADAKIIAAEAEAEANNKISSSITDELIRMKEAEARLEHGWVTVEGAGSVVTTTTGE